QVFCVNDSLKINFLKNAGTFRLTSFARNVRFSGPVQSCATALAGDAQGGGSPLVGGAGGSDACQRFLLAGSVLPAWGEPSPPRLAPWGETGKGDKIPCCRRLFLLPRE